MGRSLLSRFPKCRYLCHYYGMVYLILQASHTRDERLRAEERSKGMAGMRYENNRRSLEQSLKSKQEALQSRHRQGGSVIHSSDSVRVPVQ